jgi:hypothetical protein
MKELKKFTQFTQMSTKTLRGDKERSARTANNLSAICESIV